MQTFQAQRTIARSNKARSQFWHVAIVTSFFVIVFGASLFLGTVMVIGTFHGADPSNELTANGRAGRIARTGVTRAGRVVGGAGRRFIRR